MNLKKIKKYIINLINKKSIKNTSNKLVLNNIERSPFTKKRRSFVIKNGQIDKLKIFGNNITHYYIFILFLLFFISIFVFFGPIFKIKNIDIIKKDSITNMDISYKSVEDFRGMSIWTIDKKDVLKSLQNYQQNISDIKLDLVLPNSLNIIIDSHEGVFNTTINGKKYIITENGSLIPSSYSTDLKEIIVKTNYDKNIFLDYKKILDGEYIKKIHETKEYLKDNFINIKIEKLIYYEVEREIHMITDKNSIIIFDLDGDTKNQIQKLAIFNKEQLDISKIPVIYIDLRINNKIFYCTEAEKNQCLINLKSIYGE